MVDLLGPGAFGAARAAAARPVVTPTNGPGDPDSWAKDCSSPAVNDGTENRAGLFNMLLAQLRGLIRKSSVTPNNADDDMVASAVRSQRLNYIVVGGTADALTATLDPAPASWADLIGVPFRAIIATANATATPTFLPAGLVGAKQIVRLDGSALAAGDTKGLKEFLYDGVNVRLIGLAPSSSGRLIGIQTFTTSGTYTPTSGMTFCVVEGCGGGGAGGGSVNPSAGNVSLGASGTAGTWGKGRYTAADIGASKAVTIGAAGIGVPGAAGGDGGSTILSTLLILPGGRGGGVLNNQSPPTSNGNGVVSGAATGANIASRSGSAPFPSLGMSGSVGIGAPGGDSPLGAGGYGISANTNGTAAVGNGGGGSGVCLTAGGGTATGGNGSPGILIILEYGS